MPKDGKKGGGKGRGREKSNQPLPPQTEPVSDDTVSETDLTTRGQSKKTNKKKAAVWSNCQELRARVFFPEGSPSGRSSLSAATAHRVTTSPSPNMTVAFYVDGVCSCC